MLRLVATLSVLGLPFAGYADDPGDPTSPCGAARHGDRVELVLTADEFSIPAYDARRGLVLVQPQTDLLPGIERQFAVRLRMDETQVLMPLGPKGLLFGMESGVDKLELIIEAESTGPDCAVARHPSCDDMRVRVLHLRRGDVIISTRDLDQPLGPSIRFETRVIGRVQIERGETVEGIVGMRGQAMGEDCLRKALVRTRAIQGALTVQLGTSVVDEPLDPVVTVDGLVNPAVSSCLIDRLAEDDALWQGIGPGARTYLTLYFRGEAVEGGDDELASDSNAP